RRSFIQSSTLPAPASTAVHPLSYTTLFRSPDRAEPGHPGRAEPGRRHARPRASAEPENPDHAEPAHPDRAGPAHPDRAGPGYPRSEEHTSELQSLAYLVCRLLLEKKKQQDR